ncbi:threonine--tRNA ligase [Tenggerimyces flavus]|uniref:Threonine--tRNA ligase n=1 Tax=Tenggerimyces flavus TaxID=1708749 RepID=A0ABV7YCR5_9ACTN|nr:threonine--tRNA ligase [Tenggerimyces flavus]MBM7786914.1 threonyl-tRNA synthetase [Tenggerimyces flavus]
MDVQDHRQLGRDLGIYATDELAGAGFPLWLPDGAAMVSELERYMIDAERRAGYKHVRTPPVGKRELYVRSGHWEHFSEDIFPPFPVGGDELVLRPVLCPHHILVYGSRGRSHRELPLRLAEYDQMFRKERSGSLGGLLRVRGITLNDGHVFCTVSQAAEEAALALRMIQEAYAVLGISPAYVQVAVRGPGKSYPGSDEGWEKAEALLWEALSLAGMDAKRVEGEAAFYGPKIDIQVYDASGKEFSLSTVQIDLVLPERFDLSYIAPDGSRQRPAIVHRSVLSSMERMAAYLLERHAGAMPPWLAPVQVVVVPVGSSPYGASVERSLFDAGLRVELDDRDESLGARIRSAQLRKVPYLAVVGAREELNSSVAVRLRDGRKLDLGLDAFVSGVSAVVHARSGALDL